MTDENLALAGGNFNERLLKNGIFAWQCAYVATTMYWFDGARLQ